MIYYFYRTPGIGSVEQTKIKAAANAVFGSGHVLKGIQTECCFIIDTGNDKLSEKEIDILRWLLAETFEPNNFATTSFLQKQSDSQVLVEIGPRLNFSTAWSTNATAICAACGITAIKRMERTRRILLTFEGKVECNRIPAFIDMIHDRMTECQYKEQIKSFHNPMRPQPWRVVPVLEEGKAALERLNSEMGLAFDSWDLEYYTNLFLNMGRNPTTVECFDISQSNSEHSRHWFFKGRLVINNEEQPQSLLDLVMQTLAAHKTNSVIAYRDNSSAISGFKIETLLPSDPTKPSAFRPSVLDYDVTFTAETHNFPTGVAPFPGAETGVGGRIRDGHATGRGSLVIAGTAGYSVGNLNIPEYKLPWEDNTWNYPRQFASPIQVLIDASNGASDYGNKFGEPLVHGFVRSVGIRLPNGERREFIKPIMFSGGIGQIDRLHIEKGEPDTTMYVVKVGGPAYRIGLGGGAASSLVQGENAQELDFNAVQRGDAEMENKLNRVIRACVELREKNPIVSIHDQGAGGNANVIKELVYPQGARIEVRKILSGDESLSVLELWGAEYQENDALLIRKSDIGVFEEICRRENTSYAIVGEVTGTGRIVLHDEVDDSTPVDMVLEHVLGKMPRKTFTSETFCPSVEPLSFPTTISVADILERVLRLLAVGSKRFLTTKVDRSVTGLVAQQQCVGPLHIPLADYCVTAQTHLGLTGMASSIGEQPLRGLIDPAAMARMCLGEAMTNIVWAKITARNHIKASGNWMWPAKLPGEGDAIYKACKALSSAMIELGPAIDGGKDSMSMAAQVEGEGTVKCPGTLVISLYCTMTDITKKVTPDLKCPGYSTLVFIDIGLGKNRMGGSALAQVFSQIGNMSPDLDDTAYFATVFDVVQSLVDRRLILAGHDRSDGGLITTLLEMAFAGNCGIDVDLPQSLCKSVDPAANGNSMLANIIFPLFSEELGLVMEVHNDNLQSVLHELETANIKSAIIGKTCLQQQISIRAAGNLLLDANMPELRDIWEATSFAIEARQANPACVAQEQKGLRSRRSPPYKLTFDVSATPISVMHSQKKHKVAIIRAEGSNGDREMASAFYLAGFDPWDITMSDLLEGRVTLQDFRGIAFVGGFSFGDVLDSAKGWAGVIKFNTKLWEQFYEFYKRKDTFSLGICNGCQLMALLEWVPFGPNENESTEHQPRFVHNQSGRFESRFVTLRVEKSPAIMLRGMEGSILGVWSSHGEGRALFPDPNVLQRVLSMGLAPLKYVDDDGEPTEQYPFNPNGSQLGIAALCTPDGRHLALMPHPDRTFLKWQWPWMPPEWYNSMDVSPWLRMFQNARYWCDEHH